MSVTGNFKQIGFVVEHAKIYFAQVLAFIVDGDHGLDEVGQRVPEVSDSHIDRENEVDVGCLKGYAAKVVLQSSVEVGMVN